MCVCACFENEINAELTSLFGDELSHEKPQVLGI